MHRLCSIVRLSYVKIKTKQISSKKQKQKQSKITNKQTKKEKKKIWKQLIFFYFLNRLSYFNMLLYVIFDLYTVNKRYKIPKWQSKKDNREKLAT